MSREQVLLTTTNSLPEPMQIHQIDAVVQDISQDPSAGAAESTVAFRVEDQPDLGELLSHEHLDRTSPELWPDTFPGVSDFVVRELDTNENHYRDVPEWMSEFSSSEMDILQGFSSLTVAALLDKVKELQDLAFQLGIEESNEMTRGKFLDVLHPQDIDELNQDIPPKIISPKGSRTNLVNSISAVENGESEMSC